MPSPTPMNRTGRPRRCLTATTQPPFAVLADGVLARDGIQHQQGLQAGIGGRFLDAAADLGQLAHQVRLVVQAPGGVSNDHVIAAGGGRLHRVKNDGGGVGSLTGLDQRDPGAVGPDLQLLAGGGTEGVARGQHDPAALTGVVIGQLCDARGLAHAVDADDQDDGGVAVQLHLCFGAHLVRNELAQLVRRLLTGLQALFVHAVAELVHQFDGHFAADIGQDELFFQLIVKIIVDLAASECVQDIAPKARAGLFEAVFHLVFFFFTKSKKSHIGFSPTFYSVRPLPRAD